MPFQKGNTLGKQATIAREEHKENLWEYITSGGLSKSINILENMLEDEGGEPKPKITKTQKEGIEILLKFMPYVKARKTDITTDGEKLPTPIVNVIPTDNSNE